MVSKAIASLDQWIVQAEAVLQEQSKAGPKWISFPVGGIERVEAVITFDRFVDDLADLLTDLCARSGRWILIAEDNAQRQRFWQALAFEDGSLVTEVASNYYLSGDDAWSPSQEDRLRALGWDPVVPPRRTNFCHVESTTSPDVAGEASRSEASLREVFELVDGDEVYVKLFSSPIRGDTPACPTYVADPLGDGDDRVMLLDIDGGPDDELDPELYPDPTADDPPFGG